MAAEPDFVFPWALHAETLPADSSARATDAGGEPSRIMHAALRREQEVFRQWLEVDEQNRRHVSGEIHDEIAQPLVAALMNLDAVLSAADDGGKTPLREAVDLVRRGLAASRRLMSVLRPAVLEELGLAAALEHFVYEGGADAEVEIACDLGDQALTPALESTVYRIAEEGLANALRYSRSETVRVEIVRRGNRLYVTVEDRGVGFDQKGVGGEKFGLKAIRARARLCGGYARIHSAPGQGTSVFAELPV